MHWKNIIDFFWPFHQLNLQNVESLQENEKESARLHNRWQLIHLPPFIIRWAVLSMLLGFALYVIGGIPMTITAIICELVIGAAWLGSMAVLMILIIVHSHRPR